MDPFLSHLFASFNACVCADDLLILVDEETQLELDILGRRAIRVVQAWSNRVGVEVANDKMLMMKGRFVHRRNPFMRACEHGLRYGIRYMTDRLNFLVHYDHLKEKLTRVLQMIVLKTDWGWSRRSVCAMYGGLFATYGAHVWCLLTGQCPV